MLRGTTRRDVEISKNRRKQNLEDEQTACNWVKRILNEAT